MLQHVPRFAAMGIASVRIEGKAMGERQVREITRFYREALDAGENHPFFRGEIPEAVEHKDITRGHYFRGVL